MWKYDFSLDALADYRVLSRIPEMMVARKDLSGSKEDLEMTTKNDQFRPGGLTNLSKNRRDAPFDSNGIEI